MIRRPTWPPVFAVAALLAVAWTTATPLFASPDEPAHVIKAAGVVRGQLVGEEPGYAAQFGAMLVDVPAELDAAHAAAACLAFRPSVTADCIEYGSGSGIVEVSTTAGRHPPSYYAVVGIPSLVDAGTVGVQAMRVLSALVTAALLAGAWICLGAARHPAVARLGLAVAVTPMVLFLAGVVNPSAWEIAAAILLWSAGLALGAGTITPGFVRAAGIAGIVLALARQLGPLWLVLSGVALAVLATPEARRALVRDLEARIWAGAAAAAAAAQVGWVLVVRPLDTAGVGTGELADWPMREIVRESFGRTTQYFLESIGVFGWLDTVPPQWTYLVWTAAILALGAAGLVVARRVELAVLLAVAALAVVLPVAGEARAFHEVGFFWQGRYVLPLAVGIPLVAAWALARRAPLPGRALVVAGIALGSAQVLAYAQALRRYATGARSDALQFWFHAAWTPPVPILLLLAGFLALTALWYWLVLAPPPEPRAEPTLEAASTVDEPAGPPSPPDRTAAVEVP